VTQMQTTPLCCTTGFPAPRYCNRATTSWAGSSHAVGPSQECLPIIDVAMPRYGDDGDFSMIANDEASFEKHLLGLGPKRWKQGPDAAQLSPKDQKLPCGQACPAPG
jgi:hypothetical protein